MTIYNDFAKPNQECLQCSCEQCDIMPSFLKKNVAEEFK